MIVAFMGNDGSGKTTLGKKFGERLRVLGFDVQYRTEFDYFLLGLFFRFLGKEKVSRSRRLFLTNESGVRKPAYFKAWPYIVLVDLFVKWLWNKFSKHNRVVVMDRYAYDFLMSWEWLGLAGVRLRWLYAHFPKPDMAFILDVSPETANQRKRCTHLYSLRYYKLQRERYLQFAKTREIEVIDTGKSVDECLMGVIVKFRSHFINKLSNEDKVLLFYSFPSRDLSVLQELNISFDWSGLNWDYIVDMAVKSNTENVLCKNVLRHHADQLPKKVARVLRHVLEKSDERAKLLVKTLRVISRKLGDKKVLFLVMKTIAPFDYGATDIDILVRKEDFEKAQQALSSIFKVCKSSKTHKAVTYRGTLISVDLHHEISWLGHKVVDEVKVFGRRRKVLHKSVELSIPSREDELLILSAHSLFQHHYTTLGEFLQIVELASNKDVDRGYLLDSSGNYGWQYALQSFLSRLLWKHNFIYGSYHTFGETNLDVRPYRLGINPICFHRFQSIPRKSPQQVLDTLLTLYRSVRFKLSGQLAYSPNWLKARD